MSTLVGAPEPNDLASRQIPGSDSGGFLDLDVAMQSSRSGFGFGSALVLELVSLSDYVRSPSSMRCERCPSKFGDCTILSRCSPYGVQSIDSSLSPDEGPLFSSQHFSSDNLSIQNRGTHGYSSQVSHLPLSCFVDNFLASIVGADGSSPPQPHQSAVVSTTVGAGYSYNMHHIQTL